jgi:hypothetical protein
MTRVREARLWAIAGGVIAGLVASAVFTVALELDHASVAGLALYVVGIGAVPFAVARWPRTYAVITTVTVLFALFVAAWGLLPALPVAVALLASLFFPAPRFSRRAVLRVGAAVGAALIALALFAVTVVPGDMHLVACVPDGDRRAHSEVFELIDDPHVQGIAGADSPGGILLELGGWPSEREVDDIVRRAEAIPGVERVGRDDSTSCRQAADGGFRVYSDWRAERMSAAKASTSSGVVSQEHIQRTSPVPSSQT